MISLLYRFIRLSTLIAIIMTSLCSLVAKKSSVSGFPIIAYSNETKLMGGAFINYLKQTEKDSIRNETQITSLIIYTGNKQFQVLSIPKFKFQDRKYLVSMDLRGRYWPDKYYGIGNGTDALSYEKYTQRMLKAGMNADLRIWKQLYAGVKTAAIREEIGGFDALALPPTENLLGIDGRQDYLGYGAAVHIKTTDSDLYPTRGVNLEASYMTYQHHKPAPENHRFGMSSLELNHYASPISGAVVALQSSFTRSYDDAPFSFMPELGAKLRAYDSKRFIDKVSIAQRAEIRVFPSDFSGCRDSGFLQDNFTKSWGFVVFTEFGQVAATEQELVWKRNHTSTGFGLRYSISKIPKINIRMDFAWGGNGMNLIIQGGEVF